jgi:hypothetical protein
LFNAKSELLSKQPALVFKNGSVLRQSKYPDLLNAKYQTERTLLFGSLRDILAGKKIDQYSNLFEPCYTNKF